LESVSRTLSRNLGRVGLLLAAPVFFAGAQGADPRFPVLVSPTWVSERLTDPNLVVLHVGPRAEYDEGHLPGARFLDPNALAKPRAGAGLELSLEMPEADSLRAALQRLGISDGSRVVVYYGSGNRVPQATRVVATLQHAGLGGVTSLLDGGLPGWTRAGLAVTKDVPAQRVGSLSPLRVAPLVVTAEWVRERMSRAGFAVVDARLANFYTGETESGPQDARRRGHIPGARNVPFSSLFDGRSEWLSADSIVAAFTRAGVARGDTVVAYCHIGQQATAVVFGARVAGFPVVLYDGSFEDWARRGWPVDTTRVPRNPR
jgi:thiosulfate/3-mercaptopyruvate sulfurtransferase